MDNDGNGDDNRKLSEYNRAYVHGAIEKRMVIEIALLV